MATQGPGPGTENESWEGHEVPQSRHIAFSFAGDILIAGYCEIGLAVICSAAMRIKSLPLAINFVADCST